MKTAVEWLEDNLISEPWAEEHFKHNLECWDKAKEMEKEQIMNAHEEGFYSPPFRMSRKREAEQYYNQTFKSE
jgi:hypothetical protein